MKLSDYRAMAYKMMWVGPKYKGPVLLPSHMRENVHPDQDRYFLQELGRMHLHLLNRRKTK